jgi:hypothetical protein
MNNESLIQTAFETDSNPVLAENGQARNTKALKTNSHHSQFDFPSGVIIGTLESFSGEGMPQVGFGGNPSAPLPARSVPKLTKEHIGAAVVIALEHSDPRKPIILGVLQTEVAPAEPPVPLEVSVNGKQIMLSAQEEIVLRCGKSSITLTRAGKVLIRGAYLLSRSSGVNRIKGGSVQIN